MYDPSFLPYHGGDYTLYRIGAEEILAKGFDFSNSLFLVRPPGFPMLVAALGINEWAILGVNLIFGVLLIPLSYRLARDIGLNRQLSLVVALIMTIDLTSVKYSAVLVAEPPANFLLLLGLIAVVRSQKESQFLPSLIWMVIGASCIVVSAYMRPAAYLLWLPLSIWFIGINVGYWRRWLIGAVMIGIIMGGSQQWIAHNERVFNHGTFSTIGIYNLAYYRAASVLYQGNPNNLTIEEVYTHIARAVEAEVGNDPTDITGAQRFGHTASTAELSDAMVTVSLEIFRDYPLYYVLTVPIGIGRILFTTAAPLTALYIWGLIWNISLMILVLVGLFRLWVSKRYQLFWFIVLLSGYFVAGTLVVQTSGIDTRARSMITPLFAMAAVASLGWRGIKLFDVAEETPDRLPSGR